MAHGHAKSPRVGKGVKAKRRTAGELTAFYRYTVQSTEPCKAVLGGRFIRGCTCTPAVSADAQTQTRRTDLIRPRSRTSVRTSARQIPRHEDWAIALAAGSYRSRAAPSRICTLCPLSRAP